jgi:hypothetical protein
MRKILYMCILACLVAGFAGCSSKSDATPAPVFAADILSDQPVDGDIAFDPVENTFFITQGAETLFFGIDDSDPNLPEYRAFLDFPLDGSTGGDVVPANARIVSATLEVFINTVSFARVVPTLLDLVEYPITGLRAADFDSPPLNGWTLAFDFFATDEGQFVTIDVTPLMQEAQRLRLSDLQLRFLLDLDADFGLVGIENRPGIALTAPLLVVVYTL